MISKLIESVDFSVNEARENSRSNEIHAWGGEPARYSTLGVPAGIEPEPRPLTTTFK